MEDLISAGSGIVIIVSVVAIYFLPAINAIRDRHPSSTAIFALNLFTGWTLFGWVAALVWSMAPPRS